MSTLQVHITAGPQAGTRLQLNQSPVTFGRSAENALVLDVPVVSRQHGELILNEQGQWLLANFSSNGTRVGRRKATKKPLPLTDGVTITIGDTDVFRVYLAEPPEQPAGNTYADDEDDKAQQPDRAPGTGLLGRSKLWIGLGIWFGVCILLFIVGLVITSGEKPETTEGPKSIWNPSQVLEDDEIDPDLLDNRDNETGIGEIKATIVVRRMLAEPLPTEEPDEVRYTRHLRRADEALERGSSGLYQAYENFQIAISLSTDPRDPFDSPQTRLDYDRVLNELAEIISQEYMRAYRLFYQGNYKQASDTLFQLRQNYYPVSNPDNELANHIMLLERSSRARMSR